MWRQMGTRGCGGRWGHAVVEADVEADGDAVVEADGDAVVEADGDADVEADGDAVVEADGDAPIQTTGLQEVVCLLHSSGHDCVPAASVAVNWRQPGASPE